MTQAPKINPATARPIPARTVAGSRVAAAEKTVSQTPPQKASEMNCGTPKGAVARIE